MKTFNDLLLVLEDTEDDIDVEIENLSLLYTDLYVLTVNYNTITYRTAPTRYVLMDTDKIKLGDNSRHYLFYLTKEAEEIIKEQKKLIVDVQNWRFYRMFSYDINDIKEQQEKWTQYAKTNNCLLITKNEL